ncbi:YaaR family protein [Natranaerobius thermophilus]|uniref:DUF327 domain-containing protein n=1 Tax=Natranaerobius thermophilus (strain ATCC BAA-1301 / DSM 18059 / JW/NM-WN-LF) TaxID=457570 RepID=B2A322_NATTJ|nr:YaaR family protein [Natranaerobius thermophilus]ACB83634.1 protein of unknown function DUF327 [Natranaerobius thermophilus JW/NM-WN-LF]
MARISGIGKRGEETNNKKTVTTPGSRKVNQKKQNFQTQFSKAHKQELNKELDRLVADINEKGQNLANQMTWESFISYRQSIKNFLQVFIGEAYEVTGSRGRNRFGSQKLYRHIETIDQKLAELGEKVVKNEGEKMEVIARIDEIRGLLLDLYQ